MILCIMYMYVSFAQHLGWRVSVAAESISNVTTEHAHRKPLRASMTLILAVILLAVETYHILDHVVSGCIHR